MALALLVLSVGLFFTAWSHSPAGTIAPDWGLASWRIGLVAILPGLVLLALCLLLWRKQVRAALRRVGLCCGILLVIGSIGLLSVAPLHRLQGWWLEARGQYGLALAAYQQSGDDVATNQNMARIAVEWAEQLSAQHRYEEAVAQLQPMVALYPRDDMLAMRARDDLIRAYLAWGDQARQDQAFSVALMRYQALNQASYCNAACKSQTHHVLAQALLGLARQLTERGQYDQAAATYRQLVRDFHDTPEGQAGQEALTAPQPLRGRLVYRDATPAARFLVVLASQWAFDTTAQVFRLQGQQYRARTDATGRFSLSSVAVGTTYMVAWVDPKGHSGTCKASSNQPLYTVQAQPLRTTDAGVIDIACA